MHKRWLHTTIILTLIAGLLLSACGKKENPVATIEMEDGVKIEVELLPDMAPNTVRNFIALANKGYYDGIIFHRIIAGFMIQGGDPQGTGHGGPGYFIKGEFAANGFKKNTLHHDPGVISMARSSGNNDSAGSQFFITVGDATYLDGQYAAFGKVISGMDAVNQLSLVETDRGNNDRPLQPPVIKSIRVDTKGGKYNPPDTIKQ